MSFQSFRQISTSACRQILQLLSRVSIDDVKAVNGDKGSKWADSVTGTASAVEEQYPTVTGYEIQGAKAHKSSRDPTDPDDVITLAFYSVNGTRLLSGHVHENGSYKLAESRMGKGKAKK
ncbi:hypothetical protein H9Q72_011301 [Fusarium xylarioides]|uniref:Uncharacterized protein n=1 Tax=Fusarium xylarioides TaxID=221167 RepID=A0A9P7HQX5_9HYPO|nr:hypothetical protein H9Q72_011301 [Fusarium xylarioides]